MVSMGHDPALKQYATRLSDNPRLLAQPAGRAHQKLEVTALCKYQNVRRASLTISASSASRPDAQIVG